MLPVAWTLFAAQYAAIVRWEEARLLEVHGHRYRLYLTAVPRWWPRWTAPLPGGPLVPWRQVLFSERGTLVAVACLFTLLALKDLWSH
jgi:hypothetical protein